MTQRLSATTWTRWIMMWVGALGWLSSAAPAQGNRSVDPGASVATSTRGADLLAETSRRVDEAIRSFTNESASRDERIVQAAWGRYLERMQSIRAAVRGQELDVAMRIHGIDDGRLVLESPASATGALRVVVGRPVSLARAGSSTEGRHEADDLNYVLRHIVFRGVLNQTLPQQGAGWAHVREQLSRAEFDQARVGDSFRGRVRIDELFAFLPELEGDNTFCQSLAEHAAAGPRSANDRYELVRFGASGAWFLSASWDATAARPDRFGRTRSSLADQCLNDTASSDFTCSTIEAWAREFGRATVALNGLRESVSKFESPGWSQGLPRLYEAAARPNRASARQTLTPWLAWSGDEELFGLLWADVGRYHPATYAANSASNGQGFWENARRELPVELGLLAIAAGEADAFNLLSDDLLDPFAGHDSLGGLSLAHFAFAFRDPDVSAQLGATRFGRELQERMSYLGSLLTDDTPFGRAEEQWTGRWFDGRPAWLRERHPEQEVLREAERILRVQGDAPAEMIADAGFRIEDIGARQRLQALLERSRGPDPHGYAELFAKSREGMAYEDASGSFVFAETLGGGGQEEVPAWSDRRGPLRLTSHFGRVTTVPVVPFAPDWAGMSPRSQAGLSPADHALIVHGRVAPELSTATPTAMRTFHPPQVLANLDSAPSKVVRELRSALEQYREAVAWFRDARSRRPSAPPAREDLAATLWGEWWGRAEVFRDPSNPRRSARAAASARAQPDQPTANPQREAEGRRRGSSRSERRGGGRRETAPQDLPAQPTAPIARPLAPGADAVSLTGELHQGNAIHPCSFDLQILENEISGLIVFDGDVLKATKRLVGSVAGASSDGGLQLELEEVELVSNETRNAAYPLRYVLSLRPDGASGEWYVRDRRLGTLELERAIRAVEAGFGGHAPHDLDPWETAYSDPDLARPDAILEVHRSVEVSHSYEGESSVLRDFKEKTHGIPCQLTHVTRATIQDRILAPSPNDERRALDRLFVETFERSTTDWNGETNEILHPTPLAGRVVRFVERSPATWRAEPLGGADLSDDLLGGLEADLDFGFVLPEEKGASRNASTLDVRLLRNLLSGPGKLHAADASSVEDRAAEEAKDSYWDDMAGTLEVSLARVTEDAPRVATFAIRTKCTGSGEAELPDGQYVVFDRRTRSFDLHGEVDWDLDRRFVTRLTLEGSDEINATRGRRLPEPLIEHKTITALKGEVSVVVTASTTN